MMRFSVVKWTDGAWVVIDESGKDYSAHHTELDAWKAAVGQANAENWRKQERINKLQDELDELLRLKEALATIAEERHVNAVNLARETLHWPTPPTGDFRQARGALAGFQELGEILKDVDLGDIDDD